MCSAELRGSLHKAQLQILLPDYLCYKRLRGEQERIFTIPRPVDMGKTGRYTNTSSIRRGGVRMRWYNLRQTCSLTPRILKGANPIVVFDSWYLSVDLINKCRNLGHPCHVICPLKRDKIIPKVDRASDSGIHQ